MVIILRTFYLVLRQLSCKKYSMTLWFKQKNLYLYEYIIYMIRHEDRIIACSDILCFLESIDFYGLMKEYYMLINISSSMLCLGRFLPVDIGFVKSDNLNIIPFLTLMMK